MFPKRAVCGRKSSFQLDAVILSSGISPDCIPRSKNKHIFSMVWFTRFTSSLLGERIFTTGYCEIVGRSEVPKKIKIHFTFTKGPYNFIVMKFFSVVLVGSYLEITRLYFALNQFAPFVTFCLE